MPKKLIQGIYVLALLGITGLVFLIFFTRDYKSDEQITTKIVTEQNINNDKGHVNRRHGSIYSIKFDSNYITQYVLESESNLELLGKPLEESITERTYPNGSPGLLKKLKYEGLELQLIATQRDKVYSIFSIRVTSEKYSTPRGIVVGDTLDKLKETYPEIETLDNDPENCTYYLNDTKLAGTYDFLKFYVSNGIIDEIRIEYDGP